MRLKVQFKTIVTKFRNARPDVDVNDIERVAYIFALCLFDHSEDHLNYIENDPHIEESIEDVEILDKLITDNNVIGKILPVIDDMLTALYIQLMIDTSNFPEYLVQKFYREFDKLSKKYMNMLNDITEEIKIYKNDKDSKANVLLTTLPKHLKKNFGLK